MQYKGKYNTIYSRTATHYQLRTALARAWSLKISINGTIGIVASVHTTPNYFTWKRCPSSIPFFMFGNFVNVICCTTKHTIHNNSFENFFWIVIELVLVTWNICAV